MPESLRDAQTWLARVILDGLHEDPATCAQAGQRLRGLGRDELVVRLGAYVGGYPLRIRDSLEEAYPAVSNLLGAEAFTDLARRYARAAPAGHYDLGAAGEALASFLRHDSAGTELP
jgi:hypothetical protein